MSPPPVLMTKPPGAGEMCARRRGDRARDVRLLDGRRGGQTRSADEHDDATERHAHGLASA